MRSFICIRGGGPHPPGTWYIGEIGEALTPCRIIHDPRPSSSGVKFKATTSVKFPFAAVADYIVEPGFRVPVEHLRDGMSGEQRDLEEFQRTFEELIEPEAERDPVGQQPCPHRLHESAGSANGDESMNVNARWESGDINGLGFLPFEYDTPEEIWSDTYDADWDGEGHVGS